MTKHGNSSSYHGENRIMKKNNDDHKRKTRGEEDS